SRSRNRPVRTRVLRVSIELLQEMGKPEGWPRPPRGPSGDGANAPSGDSYRRVRERARHTLSAEAYGAVPQRRAESTSIIPDLDDEGVRPRFPRLRIGTLWLQRDGDAA